MLARGNSTGLDSWQRITKDFPTRPAGKGSEELGGIGELSYPDMLDYLRRIRVYVYTGTKPAPYTLGLIEAMLSGTPVVASGLKVDSLDQLWIGDLSEAESIVPYNPSIPHFLISACLKDQEYAAFRGNEGRQRAIELFGIDTIGAQWQVEERRDVLGGGLRDILRRCPWVLLGR